MISRVELTNWKAYEHLDLSLPPGTVFVVSKNGIGKTSLVMGAAWALFGEDHFPLDPVRFIRVGAQQATARIQLQLKDSGSPITITRTVSRDGKTSVIIQTNDDAVNAAMKFDDILKNHLGADPSFLARACILREGTALAAVDRPALDPYEHLCEVFGVQNLREGSRTLAPLLKSYEEKSREKRRHQRQDAAEIENAREELASIAATEANLRQRQSVERQTFESKVRQDALANTWRAFRAQSMDREHTLEVLLHAARGVFGKDLKTEEQLRSHLAEEESRSRQNLFDLDRRIGAAQGEINSIERLAGQLGEAHINCPVCLRPLDESEKEFATVQHTHRLEVLRNLIRDLDEERASISRLLEDLVDLRERLQDLPSLVPPNEEVRRVPKNHEGELERLRGELDDFAGKLQHLSERKGRLEELVRQEGAARHESQRLFRSYRREAVVRMLAGATESLTNEVLEHHIEPVSKELANRWKTIWNRSLPISVTARGDIKMVHDGDEIRFPEFSGGERLLAVLLLQLITVQLTTRARFCWLDEPLEHLDPQNRRLVASLLTSSASSGQFDQVVATTYEERTARRIAHLVDDAHLVYVTSAP